MSPSVLLLPGDAGVPGKGGPGGSGGLGSLGLDSVPESLRPLLAGHPLCFGLPSQTSRWEWGAGRDPAGGFTVSSVSLFVPEALAVDTARYRHPGNMFVELSLMEGGNVRLWNWLCELFSGDGLES